MAKRKRAGGLVVPNQSRRATHDLGDTDQNYSSSEKSDSTGDSWYYSDNGEVSQAYRDFVLKHGRARMKTYLPNDAKCDQCFRQGYACDVDLNGPPCSMCKSGRTTCKSQTRNTKRLVLPQNRGRAIPISGPEPAQPCRKCFQGGYRCHLVDASSPQCEHCMKVKTRCNWNLDGAKGYGVRMKEIRKLSTEERLGFAPVSREEKCYRCARMRLACDGRRPCNKCNIETTRRSCRPQGVEHFPSCIQCRAGTAGSGKSCDRGQPCKRCISKKFNCAYEAQGGLLV